MRKYALTWTAYKFLDIGIVVGSVSHVQIAIDDNRGNLMFIPQATWKTFIERRANRMQLTVPSLSRIQDLNVELVKIYNTNNLKLTLNRTYLYMKPTAVFLLFELEQCVEHVFYEMNQYMHDVSKKHEYFVFLRQNCIINKSDAANTLYKIYKIIYKNFM